MNEATDPFAAMREQAFIHRERRDRVANVIRDIPKPKGRHFVTPDYKFKEYRGKKQWTVGYYWSKLCGKFTYDVVLGAGETFEDALDAARKKRKESTS